MGKPLIRGIATFIGLAAFTVAPAKTLLSIPLKIDSAKIADYSVIREMYAEALASAYAGTVKNATLAEPCADRECALQLLKAQGADEAIFGAIRVLGQKYFLSSTLIEADGKAHSQQIQAANVEDFENATKRMADALINRKNLEQVSTVDNITESEESRLANRRTSFYSSGGSVGFTVPFGSSYQRYVKVLDDDEYCPTLSCDATTLDKSDQVFTLGWNNWFEFKNNLAMEMDLLYYAPIALAGDVNILYQFGNTDFTPFAGGGLGVHYVFPDEGDRTDSHKQNFGPAANLQGGLIMFRTYNMNLVLRGSYHVVMNDDLDNGLTVDMAVRTKVGSGSSNKYHHTSATTYLGMALGIAFLLSILVGAANN